MATFWLNEREDDADAFLHELPDGALAWLIESGARSGRMQRVVNVFIGQRGADGRFRGTSLDVPKGMGNAGLSEVVVERTADGFRFESSLVGTRTLVPSETDFPRVSSKERGCAFYDPPGPSGSPPSLTGVWRGNDDGIYYIRQSGNSVAWLGENVDGSWCNVFFGTRTGSHVAGQWVDVPKGAARGSGQLSFSISDTPVRGGDSTILMREEVTGGFGGSRWTKTDSVRLAVQLTDVTIVANADVGSFLNPPGDEPYLLPYYVLIGGDEYVDVTRLVSSRGGPPRFRSPIAEEPFARFGDWPKNNLTFLEDIRPGARLPVPEFISYVDDQLRAQKGLRPESASGGAAAVFVPFVLGADEASSRNEDVRALHAAIPGSASTLQRSAVVPFAEAVASGGPPPSPDTSPITAAASAAFRESIGDRFEAFFRGGLDADKFMIPRSPSVGRPAIPIVPFWALRAAALKRRPLSFALVLVPKKISGEGAGAPGATWLVSGRISATLAPRELIDEFDTLEVTLETGDDDFREGSVLRISLESLAGGLRGPFMIHPAGLGFPNHSRHTSRIGIGAPVLLGNQTALHLHWQRDPSAHFLEAPDSWVLQRLRVVLFDTLGRRHVLVPGADLGHKFEADETLRFPLPRA
jgi:hypothetical protein